MLAAAETAFVYRGTAEPHEGAFGHVVPGAMGFSRLPFLVKSSGKHQFDLSQECVDGWEFFWNASGCRRGTIAVMLPGTFDFSTLATHGFDCGIQETPNSGRSPGAIRLARNAQDANTIAVLFSASSGMTDMEVFASAATTEQLGETATALCGATSNASPAWLGASSPPLQQTRCNRRSPASNGCSHTAFAAKAKNSPLFTKGQFCKKTQQRTARRAKPRTKAQTTAPNPCALSAFDR